MNSATLPVSRHTLGFPFGRMGELVFVGTGCVIRSDDYVLRLGGDETRLLIDRCEAALTANLGVTVREITGCDIPGVDIFLENNQLAGLLIDYRNRDAFTAGRAAKLADNGLGRTVLTAADDITWSRACTQQTFWLRARSNGGQRRISWDLPDSSDVVAFWRETETKASPYQLAGALADALAGNGNRYATPLGDGVQALLLHAEEGSCRISRASALALADWLENEPQRDI